MKRTITCIICPKGCTIEADTESLVTSGNFCKRGAEYAISECTNPMRVVTSAMNVENRDGCRISVKTKLPVPKSAIYDIMNLIHWTTVSAPVNIGDVIISDICGTEIIATSDIK